VATEVALVAPALLALLMLVIVAARVTHAQTDVQSAATAAARAASLRSTPAAATDAARDTATANLDDAGITCRSFEVETATSDLRPGGTVSVTVQCIAEFSDIALLAVPGSRAFTAQATEVVDTYLGEGAQ
jgi:Flp pilus assembly protein TadG